MTLNSKSLQPLLRPLMYLALGILIGWLFFYVKNPSSSSPQAQQVSHDHSAQQQQQETIWTCSMHPQIRQPEPGTCPICEMDLIPAGAAAEGDPLVFRMSEEAVMLASIETIVVGAKGTSNGQSIRFTGVVKPDERQVRHQVSHLPGRVEALYVQFTGQQIRAGQRIARVYSPELVQAQRELLEAAKLSDVAPAMREAARQKLVNLRIPTAQIDAIESSGEVRTSFDVYADHSGIVTELLVSSGDYVREGEVLFQVTNLASVWVLFDAYEQDLTHVSIGDMIRYTVPSVPGATYEGRVKFIDHVLDQGRRTARLRVEQANPRGTLKPEMYVQGTLIDVDRGQTGLTVPRTAVLWTGKRSVVWVKEQDTATPAFRFREVTLGPATADGYLIEEGLSPGEEIVVRGAFTLDAAAQLNNQSSMMNRLVTESGNDQRPQPFEDVPASTKATVNAVLTAYMPLKKHLVEGDFEAAQKALIPLSEAVKKLDDSALTGEAASFLREKRPALTEQLESMRDAPDLADLREQFAPLSATLIEVATRLGVSGSTWYVQHCPMALDDEGADWISDVRPILNPYFGDRMLKCGVVKDSL
jgi:membrane fusion protein, copper/silver efflux system